MKRSEITFFTVIGTLGAHTCLCIALAVLQNDIYHGMIAMLSVGSAILYTIMKNKGITLRRPLMCVSISLGWAMALFTIKVIETSNIAFIILAVMSCVASVLHVSDFEKGKK